MWPFKRDRPDRESDVSPKTVELTERTDRLAARIAELGVETRAVAKEAHAVRAQNHFGPALTAAFSTPRNPS